MKIDITCPDTSGLCRFTPVEGTWSVRQNDEADETTIIDAIGADLAPGIPLTVSLFHADGRAITSELPSEGTFLAMRKTP